MEPQFERRQVQRVYLTEPLRGRIGDTKMVVVDLSVRGICILHQDEIGPAGSMAVVRAEWDGHSLELRCRITRTSVHRPGDAGRRTQFVSGLMIVETYGDTSATLRRIIEHHVLRALDEQKANARGIPPRAPNSMQTGSPSAFVRHEFILGRWREVASATATQPDNGFTISAHTSRPDVEMLRWAYEAANTTTERAVIRRMAALSVNTGEVVQARRYMP
jgi:hypothetical protein